MEMLEVNNGTNQPVGSQSNTQIINQHHHQQQHHNQTHQQHLININPSQKFRAHQQPYQGGPRYVNNVNTQHRELPVDVPDSFVAIAKQSPRYPPPKPHRKVSPPMPLASSIAFHNNNHNNQQHVPTTTTLPQSNNNNVILANRFPKHPPNTQSTAANIATHNNSLRSSIKLKQLERRAGQNGNYPVGHLQAAVNQAFELEEDASATSTNINMNSIAPNNTNYSPMDVNNTPSIDATTTLTVTSINQANKASLKMKQTMPDLCSIYDRLQRNLNGDFNDVAGDAKFAKLLSIYNTIVGTHNKQFRIPNLTSRHTTTVTPTTNDTNNQLEPVACKVSDLLQSVALRLPNEDMTEEVAELLCILCKHEVDGVCSAFDRIVQSFEFAKSSPLSPQPVEQLILEGQQQPNSFQSQHQPPPVYHQNMQQPYHQHHQTIQQSSQMEDYEYAQDQVQMDIENNPYHNSLHPLTDIDLTERQCIKMVKIERGSTQALGATIKNEEDGSVVIGRIICGGDADRSGLLHEGDEILEVNGIPMRGKNINDVVNILEGMDGTLKFEINIRTYNKPLQRAPSEKHFVKAFFSYDAEHDAFMPCKELGLSFERGEILSIIDRGDPNWWQARREGDSDSEWQLAGLIPSIRFLKQQEKDVDHDKLATVYSKSERKNLVSLLFNCPEGSSSPRRRKKRIITPYGLNETQYYEEVCLHYPIKYRKRPIVLVGPKMIGQQEIRDKLLEDTNRFVHAISHTSKPRESHERNGLNFHFVTKAQFEAKMKAGEFIECGQYQSQYYGTTFDAMKEAIRSKKTCIHMVNTPSIFNLRQGRVGSELKPFFVFIRPNDSHPEKLRKLVSMYSPAKSNIDENIKAVMSDVETIETHYLPFIDMVINVSDVQRAYQDLLFEIEKIETEPQWIPMFWQELPSS